MKINYETAWKALKKRVEDDYYFDMSGAGDSIVGSAASSAKDKEILGYMEEIERQLLQYGIVKL